MSSEWLPIRYRDFYDFPRAVVIEKGGEVYLFDSLFNEEADDYEPDYTVYRLPDDLLARLDEMSWIDLAHLGEVIGTVPVTMVEFDPTRRKALHRRAFDLIRTK